ncbi:hypothetical protein KCP77_19380 [Salmonella enterica subsp. enterica]|nr:hypothetical protein KCP77_19380 [Salmonella enterica subsp. enterica]
MDTLGRLLTLNAPQGSIDELPVKAATGGYRTPLASYRYSLAYTVTQG